MVSGKGTLRINSDGHQLNDGGCVDSGDCVGSENANGALAGDCVQGWLGNGRTMLVDAESGGETSRGAITGAETARSRPMAPKLHDLCPKRWRKRENGRTHGWVGRGVGG